jgi:chitinase
LKKSFISSNKRYWDDQSKVPFLFNPSTGIWISYDDVESINIKNNYIKQKRLGGAFFWELSSDRQAELVGVTFNALSKDVRPIIRNSSSSTTTAVTTSPSSTTKSVTNSSSSTAIPVTTSPSSTTTVTSTTRKAEASTKPLNQGHSSEWQSCKSYSIDDQVTYQGKTYRCRQNHMSLSDWMPSVVPALWLEI